MNSAPSQAEIPSKNVQHNQSLFSVQLQLRWYWFSTLLMEEEYIKQKQRPAVNWESPGACWAAVQRISVPNPSCYKSNSSHLRQHGTALTALNGSRRLIPPLDQSCRLQNDCPRRCQRECIIHLLHILSLWVIWLPALARHYFYRRHRSISAVQLSQNHRMSEPFGGPCSDRLMIKTAEIMLTSLSRFYKPVISGDVSPPLFFFNSWRLVLCATFVWGWTCERAQEVKCCSRRSVYLRREAVFCLAFYCWQSCCSPEWTTAHPVARLWVWTGAIFCNHSTV